MTTIEEHRKIIKEFVDDINEKIKAGLLVERQKIIGFSSSEAATNMFAVYLHERKLVEPSFSVNHRFFASKRIAELKFNFDFPLKERLFELLVAQEMYRNKLCYGRSKDEKIVSDAIKNLFEIKKLIERKGEKNV